MMLTFYFIPGPADWLLLDSAGPLCFARPASTEALVISDDHSTSQIAAGQLERLCYQHLAS